MCQTYGDRFEWRSACASGWQPSSLPITLSEGKAGTAACRFQLPDGVIVRSCLAIGEGPRTPRDKSGWRDVLSGIPDETRQKAACLSTNQEFIALSPEAPRRMFTGSVCAGYARRCAGGARQALSV